MKTKLLITGLALMAVTSLANAQNQDTGKTQKGPDGKGCEWVDANKNGICDYAETSGLSKRNGRRMANNQGSNQGQRQGQGYGPGTGQCRGLGQGQGRGMGQGGRNFIDADKNGICDIYEKSVKK